MKGMVTNDSLHCQNHHHFREDFRRLKAGPPHLQEELSLSKKHFKQLILFYKPYCGIFAADLLCAVAKAAISLIIPLGVRYIANRLLGTGAGTVSQVMWMGLGLLALVAVKAFCDYFFDYQGHYLGAKIERDMRAQLFNHCQRLSFSYYDEHTVGDLMSRITNDTLSMAEFFHHVPEDLVVNTGLFLGAMVILLNIHWQTTLVMLAFLPFMVAYTMRFNKKMCTALESSRRSMAEINTQVEDSLSGIRVVQSFTGEDMEEEKFRRRNARFLEDRRRSYQGEAQLYTGMDVFAMVIPIAVVVFGGLAILNGGMNISDLLVFLLYIGYFTGPIQSLVNTSRLLQEGRTSFRRYRELMETQPQIVNVPAPVKMEEVSGRIEFSHVGFSYGQGEAVFHDLNLTIEAGEYVALVGASGVGKTTLCALIPRLYEPQSGQVLLDGIDVRDIPLDVLRKNIGVVQQDVYLFTGTVAENIAYGKPGASREEIMEAAKLSGAHDFIQGLPGGYDANIGPHGVKLSGGQQQRISIARVFLKDPPVLIFDEATSALDNHSEKLVQRSLEHLARRRTTLVIAHRLSTVQNAGRIVVLDENGICEQGTHDELIRSGGVYAGLYQASVKF